MPANLCFRERVGRSRRSGGSAISSSHHAPARSARLVLVAAFITSAALLTGSGSIAGATGAHHTGIPSAVLRISSPFLPLNLNPVLDGYSVFDMYTLPAYSSLIFATPKGGQYKPELAKSFGYVGKGNKRFTMTLRAGIKFSDGTPMTAQDVVKSIRYFQTANGPEASTLSAIKTATASGKYKINLKLSSSNPLMPLLFSQEYTSGEIINPKAIKKPSMMSDATWGAGPYMLDPAQTVLNDHYTYVPNPHYYAKSQLKYGEITIKNITNPTSALQAIKTGQVDVALGDPSTADAAKASGLKIYPMPTATQAFFLRDRKGKVLKPLGDVRVRQALNYAINRPVITRAIFGKYAAVTDQMCQLRTDLYDKALQNYYPYNPKKAKQLLKAAGYKNGFTMTVLSNGGFNDTFAEAVAGYLAKVGVKVKLDSEQPAQFNIDNFSQKFAVTSSAYGGAPGWFESQLLIAPGGVLNPFHSSDKTINKLLNKLGSANPGSSQEKTVAHQIEARVVKLAWFLPVMTFDEIFYASKSVGGLVMDFTGTSDILKLYPK
jgi:peptide/nickel transport system substrate-binding protein